MKKCISLSIVLCMLVMLMSGALPAFADATEVDLSSDAFAAVVVNQVGTSSETPLTFALNFGESSVQVSGLDLQMKFNVPNGSPEYSVTVNSVNGEEVTKLGSWVAKDAKHKFNGESYHYFLPFDEVQTFTGTQTIEFVFDASNLPEEQSVDFEQFTLIDATRTADAYSLMYKATVPYQFLHGSGGLGDSISWVGADDGNDIVTPNVDFDGISPETIILNIAGYQDDYDDNFSLNVYLGAPGEDNLLVSLGEQDVFAGSEKGVAHDVVAKLNAETTAKFDFTKLQNVYIRTEKGGDIHLNSFSFTPAFGPFDFVPAYYTTTNYGNLGISKQYECTANGSANKERMALEYIYDAELSYTYDLGDEEASGMEILLGIMWDGQGSKITAYKEVGGVKTKLGSYTTEAEYYYAHYRRYFISFNDENLTGSGTLILEFNNDTAQNTNQWIGFSGYTFIDASNTADAFSELNQKTSYQISGPDNDSGSYGGEGYGWFGDGGLGDYVTITNVDFGETGAAGMSFFWSTGDGSLANENSSVKVYYGGADGTEVLSLDYNDLKDLRGESKFAFSLDKAIPAGVHNIYVRVRNFSANFRNCQFIPTKDGTVRMWAGDNDNIADGVQNVEEDGQKVNIFSWFGNADGERIEFAAVDFKDKEMTGIRFNFSPWGGNDEAALGTGKIEVYANNELLATLTDAQLRQHINSYTTYTLYLAKPLTGINTISITSYWTGSMKWFEFLTEDEVSAVTRDGFERILATSSDSDLSRRHDGFNNPQADDLYVIAGWLGTDDGETLKYDALNFRNKKVTSMDIRFWPWTGSDVTDTAKNGAGKVDIYANEELVGTIPYEVLNENQGNFISYTIEFQEPLTGINDIKITSYWQGSLSWFRFNDGVDGILLSDANIVSNMNYDYPDQKVLTGKVSVDYRWNKPEGDTRDKAEVIFACYDENNKLVANKKTEIDLSASNSGVAMVDFGTGITGTDPSNPQVKTVRVFVWDSEDGMVPIATKKVDTWKVLDL